MQDAAARITAVLQAALREPVGNAEPGTIGDLEE